MNVMNFGEDMASANEAVSFCSKSGVVAYSTMSTMFSIGTLLKVQLNILMPGGGQPNAATLEAAAAAMPAIARKDRNGLSRTEG